MKASKNSLSPTIQMRNSGFTLIELMVTIAVLAIIVGIAAPSISTQLANQRVKSTTATLANALKEAKAESIIRRQNVTLSYNNTSTPKMITVTTPDSKTIANYSYNVKSTITDSESKNPITFEPSKRVESTVYTICDENAAATPRQVSISKLANISIINSGSC
ncbi:Tfp pilus assembly protein FimT/FimU [Psychrobacter sp. Marseille-P5312]|uniref:pilus assembly FimT family protein n=1 Tax=Psychrobacter sp. Marseille-P5312 TaxID=2086574 RepID=UPI001D0D6E8D|nr:GspH/FimT family pseudopilin [Psychrobacter sp. Marseille-P5312]